MKHVAACSFGKDSIATVILAREHNEPLDEVIYCEVMFDEEISGEVPEHRQFIYEVAKPLFESWGIKVTILRSEKTYISNFMHVIKKGKQAGKIRAFPLCGRCTIQRDCKLPPIERYKRELGDDVIQYLGIAKDEQERLLRLEGKQKISLLEKTGLKKAKLSIYAANTGFCRRYMNSQIAVAAGFVRMQGKENCGTYSTITKTYGRKCWSFKPCRIRLQKGSAEKGRLRKLMKNSEQTTHK